MENKQLDKIWNMQNETVSIQNAEEIITKAKRQRKVQVLGVVIMGLTVLILLGFTIYVLPLQWNNFSLGLILMIGSLLFRIILEMVTMHRKKSKLIAMDAKSYRSYLKKFYQMRLIINYVVTPVCFVIYIYGFYLLLPYFKNEFSEGFYTYILISGIISLLVIAIIIINSVLKEHRFLRTLKEKL